MRRKPFLWIAVGLAAALVIAFGISVLNAVKRHHKSLVGISTVQIPASDGVQLTAMVMSLAKSGQHPLVVMPTSWGAEQTQYQNLGRVLMNDGFIVVAYKQRGFDHLGGSVDFAGPTTVKDASTVIDWALAHTASDPARIGMLGDSYGGGVSLLTAERDPRVKAVVAMSTWTDWGYSFAPNNTVSTAALTTLFSVAQKDGLLDADMAKLASVYRTNPTAALTLIHSLAAARSPIADVAALNAHHTAVLLANGVQDSIFGPQQLVDFYAKLTGPKRLDLGLGDHTQPEVRGFLTGNHVGPVGDAIDWLLHYLGGQANGINTQPPIQLTDATTGQAVSLSSWPTAGAAQAQALALPDGSTNNGGSGVRWSTTLTAGHLTVANSPATMDNITQPYQFGTADLAKLGTTSALQWSSPAVTSPLTLAGTSVLHFTVACSAPHATVYAYLYDVRPNGHAALMSVTPDTISGLGGTTSRSVALSLAPTAWTIPAHDHVSLVVTTADSRWSSQTPAGSTITVSSPQSDPATLSVPLRG